MEERGGEINNDNLIVCSDAEESLNEEWFDLTGSRMFIILK
ncbi:hypothetical protein [Lactococcus petauri]